MTARVAHDERAPGSTRRARRVAATLLVIALSASLSVSAAADNGFTDVGSGSTHGAAIEELAAQGILLGYGDGTFGPRDPITRGQIASVLARAEGLPSAPPDPGRFSDVSPGSTHAGAIGPLVELGVIEGYEDGTFRPRETIRRDHMALMVARWLDLEPVDDGPFTDVSRYEGQINALVELGIVQGTTATTFSPDANLTRGQTASLVSRALASLDIDPDVFQLTVLHANDGESELLPTDDLPGAARFVADLTAMQRAAERFADRQPRAAITISSGDNYLAGPRLNASLESEDQFYDALVFTTAGFDAMTIGNHEFDFGPDVLADFIEATDDIPFISANLDVSAEPRLAALEEEGRFAGSTVVTKAGRDIGVVGATTEQLNAISSPRDVVVDPNIGAAVQAEVDALQADGVDIIILSSHLQDLNEELSLVPTLTGVDAVIGGGGGEALGEDYPLVAQDADGRDVPVVTTPGSYADIGRLVLEFDAAGDLVGIGGGEVATGGFELSSASLTPPSALVPVPLDGPRDAFVEEFVEAPVAAYVADLGATVVATTEVPLDGRRQDPGVRDRETNLGDLLADGLLNAARERADEFGVPEADVALQNGGGMRQEQIIPVGDVTELDTFDIAAFANFVSVAEVAGAELHSALERSVSALPGAAGFHGQWAGVEFTYDTDQQAQEVDFDTEEVTQQGERIVDAVVTTADGSEVVLVADGVLEAPDETFAMASINFIFDGGGDGYFDLDVDFTTLGVTYQQALFDRFDELGTVTADDYPDLSVDFDRHRRFGPVGGDFIE